MTGEFVDHVTRLCSNISNKLTLIDDMRLDPASVHQIDQCGDRRGDKSRFYSIDVVAKSGMLMEVHL